MRKPVGPRVTIAPGIERETLVHGGQMYQMRARLASGSVLPVHHHPQEQIVHLLKGRLRLTAAGVTHELEAGDSFYLAANVPHGVETLEASEVLDTFSPPRDDYLAADKA